MEEDEARGVLDRAAGEGIDAEEAVNFVVGVIAVSFGVPGILQVGIING